MMRHLDLCSGIGGFALGFEWAGLSKPVMFCDIEPWSRQVLTKHWPDVPITDDVKELANDPDGLIPDCDIITAGYPCQPFSLAGKRRGTEDDRHIWPFIFSILQAKRPAWCVFENVYGHVSMGLDEVLSDLEGEGYAARPFIVPACAVDAPHRRDRLWIIVRNVGDTNNNGASSGGNFGFIQSKQDGRREKKAFKQFKGSSDISRNVGDTKHEGLLQRGKHEDACQESVKQSGIRWDGIQGRKQRKVLADAASKRQPRQGLHGRPVNPETYQDWQADRLNNGSKGKARFWLLEPAVGRVAHGIPRRVDRLRGLGNAIVPQVAQRIGETIKQVAYQSEERK